jgi:hypothetical protein
MSIGHRHTPRCSINSYRDPTAGRPSGRSNMFTVPRLMVRMVEEGTTVLSRFNLNTPPEQMIQWRRRPRR